MRRLYTTTIVGLFFFSGPNSLAAPTDAQHHNTSVHASGCRKSKTTTVNSAILEARMVKNCKELFTTHPISSTCSRRGTMPRLLRLYVGYSRSKVICGERQPYVDEVEVRQTSTITGPTPQRLYPTAIRTYPQRCLHVHKQTPTCSA